MVAEAQLRLAAARGDRVALREALARLLARSPIPAIRLEMVMNDPQIRAQLGAEEWAALQREHRP
jgi:outer membrane protein TolC